MAQLGNLVELFAGQGRTDSDGYVRGTWSQNLFLEEDGGSVRKGFGQVAELDTTLGLNLDAEPYGYDKHLGSCAIETLFGHTQILSVFNGRASTSSMAGEETNARWANLFFVRIYDVTTDRHYEEVLYRQTSSYENNLNSLPMSEWYGNYETNKTFDNRKFLAGRDEDFFFEVLNGYVLFGSESTGLYVYRPADFRDIRIQQVEDSDANEYCSGYSESSIISRMDLVDGKFSDSRAYMNSSEVGRITDITQVSGRVVFATHDTIYFSDHFTPNAVMAANSVRIPIDTGITGVQRVLDKLLVFGETETFLYTPSVAGGLASQGRLVRISDSVGCIGPTAIVGAEDIIFWVGKDGVYTNSGTPKIDEISNNIGNFFNGTMPLTNPLTSFFETSNDGFADTNIDQPRTTMRLEAERISMAYSPKDKMLLVAVPRINALWCYRKGWSFWSLESCVSLTGGGAPQVGVQKNLLNPWITYADEDFYLTIGTEAQVLDDQGFTVFPKYNSGNAIAVDGTPRSYAICRLGLGGALDRSIDTEDYRLFPRKYVMAASTGTVATADARMRGGIFYIRPPVYDESDDSYWLPIEAVPPEFTTGGAAIGPIRKMLFRFRFDLANYDARPNGAGNITYRLPPERTATGFTAITCDAGGVADPAGEYIEVEYDGTGGDLNLTRRQSNPIVWVSLKARNTNTTSSFKIDPHTHSMEDATPNSRAMNVFVYAPYKVEAEKKINNARTQPVDWAFKSDNKQQKGVSIRARGLFTRIASRGSTLSTDGQIFSGWAWGVLNVLLGADRKTYTSQLIDLDESLVSPAIRRIVNHQSLRSRFRGKDETMQKRVFNGNAGNVNKSPLWGIRSTPASGNYLIDDEQEDNIAVSDSVKGEELNYMVFGFMRGRADGLMINSILANIRALGSRRRTGRG